MEDFVWSCVLKVLGTNTCTQMCCDQICKTSFGFAIPGVHIHARDINDKFSVATKADQVTVVGVLKVDVVLLQLGACRPEAIADGAGNRVVASLISGCRCWCAGDK